MPFKRETLMDEDDPSLQDDPHYQFSKKVIKGHVYDRLINEAENVSIYTLGIPDFFTTQMGFEPGKVILFHHDEYAIIHCYERCTETEDTDHICLIIMEIERSLHFAMPKDAFENYLREGLITLYSGWPKPNKEISFEYWNNTNVE